MPELKEEQREVINHEEGNILVSASAGSGKTFVMIERLIRLITEGKTSVKNVLCVTFTEAAAFEMKQKLKKALSEKIASGEEKAEELLAVETADICTIHSFCARLIRKYFYAAEVSPDFKIAEETKAELLVRESIDEVFAQLYKEKDSDFLTLLRRHGKYRADKSFKSLITETYKFLQVDADPEKYMQDCLGLFSNLDLACKKYKEYLLVTLNNLKSYAEDLLCRAKGLSFDNAEVILCQLIADMQEVINGDIYTARKFEGYKLSLTFGRKLGAEKEALREEVKKLHALFQSLIKRVNDHVSDRETDEKKGLAVREHLEKLFKIVKLFGEGYAKKKEAENVLDFADLEHFALKVLKDEQTLEAIRSNYRYVFADEYQDVNGVQEEILSRVSNNNLFMVGDVKQSIYGFRGCRPEIFEGKEKNMRERGEKTVRLNHNFRSANGILDAVNKIFSYSMTNALYGTDYKSTATLVGGGIYPEEKRGQTSFYLLNKEKEERVEEKSTKLYDLLEDACKNRENNPSNIALLIEDIIRRELGKKFYDTKKGEERNVTFSDIVILNKNKDNKYVFSLVSDLLRLNIPVSSEVAENVCVYPEIQLLISILKLLDCKADDIPLVSVLKSPVGNFTEKELLKISLLYKDYLSSLDKGQKKERNYYSSYRYALENLKDETGEKLRKFDEYIDKMRFLADFYGAGKILEKIIADSGLENYIAVKGKSEEKLKRINFFLKKAVDEKIYTVHEFLNLIEKSPKAFMLSPSADDEAVRVMTIHASKGLEFPVVIVCGLEKGVNKRAQSEEVLKDYTLGLALKNYDDKNKVLEENLFRGLFKEKMRIDKIKEDLRLFYVATTRASYFMHLTFESKSDVRRNFFIGADKFIDYLPLDMEAVEVNGEDIKNDGFKREEKRKILVGEVDEAMAQKIEKNLSFSYPYSESLSLPLKCSVTKAVTAEKEETTPSYAVVLDEETGVGRGITAHKILELIDFGTIDNNGFITQVNRFVELGYLTQEEVLKIDLDKLYLAVSNFAKSVQGKTLFREQPFLANVEGKKVLGYGDDQVLVQGIIDLLAVDKNGAEIIDYKYSVLSGESLKKKYSMQLELYAIAVEKVLKVKVNKKTLVNILSGECIDF